MSLEAVGEDLQAAGQRLEQRTDAEAGEHALRSCAASLARDQHLGARRPFWVGQRPVLAFDEQPAQRDHEQHAEQSAGERQQRHLEDGRIEVPQEQRRDGEDDAARHRARRRADGLRHVGFENAAALAGRGEHLVSGDGHDRDGNGGRDREPGAQSEVGVRGAEDDAEEDAGDVRLEGGLRQALLRRDIGAKRA